MLPIMNKVFVEKHFDQIAGEYDYWKKKNSYYYNTIKTFLSKTVHENSSVLEVGCATGELLDAVNPAHGVGVDISAEMIKIASSKYPQHKFIHSSIENLILNETFDFIILVDVVDHVYDVANLFKNIRKFCKPSTRIVLTTINPWWDPMLSFMESIGAKMPEGPHNFIEKGVLEKTAEIENLSVSYSGYLLLFPKYIPLLSYLANCIGVRAWLINKCSSVQYMIMRPLAENEVDLGYGCSVVIPCYNEAGNISDAIKRIPKMGKETEIIVVDDGSSDGTGEKVKELQRDYANLKLISYSPNKGKGQAVKIGFEAATQEVLIVLDADISVPPEELPRFFNPLNKGMCQFVNGTRLVYPMEDQAMRVLNMFGNKIFGFILSFLIQQSLTDTLCGTKAMLKEDLKRVKWGIDKWGDFDLLFSASKLGNKIVEVPVHYMSRKTGESKMKSFNHGFHLLKACFLGFKELIFIPKREFYYNFKSK